MIAPDLEYMLKALGVPADFTTLPAGTGVQFTTPGQFDLGEAQHPVLGSAIPSLQGLRPQPMDYTKASFGFGD
jgi:hypothetical protein